MSKETLLVELLTEELPPRALSKLSEAFASHLHKALQTKGLFEEDRQMRVFATPRRLGVQITNVKEEADAKTVEEKLMPVAIGLLEEDRPSPALLKKMEAKGIPIAEFPKFERRMDGKAEALFYRHTQAGTRLDAVLASLVSEALKALPIPKLMRWGDKEEEFVRPVHSLILLHGSYVIPGKVLGLVGNRHTQGHRFLGKADMTIPKASDYEDCLMTEGKVIADFATRRAKIAAALVEKAAAQNAHLKLPEALLDEVTALVEWPCVYVASFDKTFLEVPEECLILTMQQNQKYFPLYTKDDHGKDRLTNQFLIVSNMEVADPTHIISGNAKVIRPRLSDARFFFDQDRKAGFASRALKLSAVVYHNKLGSLGDRAERLGKLAAHIAEKLGADAVAAKNAGLLCKVDLLTDMVGEFPELQGVMGRYYALHEGLRPEVADAMSAHYLPRFAGDTLPKHPISLAVALADKLDALVGFFGIGQTPTGDKDPFALRRAALGVLRILKEMALPLDVKALIRDAQQGFPAGMLTHAVDTPLFDFIEERLRGLLKDEAHAPEVIEAVLARHSGEIADLPARLWAVADFRALPEALSLAAANKRIGNLLKKSDESDELGVAISETLLTENAEKALFAKIAEYAPIVKAAVLKRDYSLALKTVSGVSKEVDHFFEEVMVLAKDDALRKNRIALLRALSELLNAVADISKLSVS